jgi:two-component system chemotaxis sensor kinase CheA
MLLLAVCLAGEFLLLRHQAKTRAEENLASLLSVVSHGVSAGLDFDSQESVRDALMGVFRIQEVHFAGVTNLDGSRYQSLGNWMEPSVRASETPTIEWCDGYLIGHAPIRDNASRMIGTLHIGLETERLRAELQQGLLVILVAGLLLVLLAAAVTMRFGRNLTAPILDLAGAARAMADGRFERPLRVHREDEVGLVAVAFNDMASRLEDSHRQIEEQNRELERKVRERTDELRAKNMALAHQNEKVMEVSRLKSAFLANMSHELRTPLNAILALSELLRDGIMGPLGSDEQVQQVGMIHDSGENLLNLINDVLDLSKIEAGRMEIRFQECEIQEVLRSAVAAMDSLAAEKGLELRVRCEGDGRGWIDPDRLRQVFLNLLGNAIKFTTVGHVEVTSRLDLDAQVIEVSIEDTGQGIDPEEHERIFQEFRQVDGSATRRHGGTGLGLSICRRLLMLMGGEVSVQSSLGNGATFTFSVPVFRSMPDTNSEGIDSSTVESWAEDRGGRGLQQAPEELVAASVPRRSGKGCILVVDDDETQVAALQRYLTQEGFEVHAARNGQEAINELRELQPDLLVLDLLMPGMSGFDVIDRLQADPTRFLLPVVVYTAKELEDHEWRKLQRSVSRILHKGSSSVRLLVEDIEGVLNAEGHRGSDDRIRRDSQAA